MAMKTRSVRAMATVVLVGLVSACGGEKIDPRFPPRAEGCDVEVFHEDAPSKPVDNIGAVNASCTDQVGSDECLRTLKDQVCKMGGDVVWGVEPAPVVKPDGRKHLSGRAAKSRAARPTSP